MEDKGFFFYFKISYTYSSNTATVTALPTCVYFVTLLFQFLGAYITEHCILSL